MKYRVTAFDLKLALLHYLRFERQWICVDEFRGADVIADTGKEIFEVEVKVSKYDLVKGEDKKHRKHHFYRIGQAFALCHPNKFYFCVPESLVAGAVGVCERLNPKYGIIAFNTSVFERQIQRGYNVPHVRCLRMARSAKKLHDFYANHQQAIAKRASSKLISLMGIQFKEWLNKEEIKNDTTYLR